MLENGSGRPSTRPDRGPHTGPPNTTRAPGRSRGTLGPGPQPGLRNRAPHRPLGPRLGGRREAPQTGQSSPETGRGRPVPTPSIRDRDPGDGPGGNLPLPLPSSPREALSAHAPRLTPLSTRQARQFPLPPGRSRCPAPPPCPGVARKAPPPGVGGPSCSFRPRPELPPVSRAEGAGGDARASERGLGGGRVRALGRRWPGELSREPGSGSGSGAGGRRLRRQWRRESSRCCRRRQRPQQRRGAGSGPGPARSGSRRRRRFRAGFAEVAPWRPSRRVGL